MRVHQFLGEGDHKKTIYRGNCLKRGLGQFAEGLAKKREESVFEGGEGWYPDAHYYLVLVLTGTWDTTWASWIGQDLSCSIMQRKKEIQIVLLDLNLNAEYETLLA